MTIKLNLEDRHYINMYSRRLRSTIQLRYSIDSFFDKLNITPEEMKKYGVSIDPNNYEFKCNDDTYEVEYESFPSAVIESMKEFIKTYDHGSNKNNEMIQKMVKYFNKIINS